jgi:hypothetical protein
MPRTQRDEEIIAHHSCKKCYAKIGEPCIYLDPENYQPSRFTRSGRAILDKVGKDMVRVHLERSQAYEAAQRVLRRKRELEHAKATQPPWLMALRQFDLDEREAMRQWLRANYRMFGLRRR